MDKEKEKSKRSKDQEKKDKMEEENEREKSISEKVAKAEKVLFEFQKSLEENITAEINVEEQVRTIFANDLTLTIT